MAYKCSREQQLRTAILGLLGNPSRQSMKVAKAGSVLCRICSCLNSISSHLNLSSGYMLLSYLKCSTKSIANKQTEGALHGKRRTNEHPAPALDTLDSNNWAARQQQHVQAASHSRFLPVIHWPLCHPANRTWFSASFFRSFFRMNRLTLSCEASSYPACCMSPVTVVAWASFRFSRHWK